MSTRIFSWVVGRALPATAAMVMFAGVCTAQNTGYYTDEATGIVYRQVTKTVEKPVVETKIETREQTVYRPQTVTETKPEARTVYTPVLEYKWEPRLEGRWNPFRQPTVAYHHVPTTRWEARAEVVNRTNMRTEWVAEKRTVDVPQRLVRMEREQKVEYEPVARVAPKQDPASTAIAARLKPLDSNTPIQPLATSAPVVAYQAPRIAASSVGRLASDPPRRSSSQTGMRSPGPVSKYGGRARPSIATDVDDDNGCRFADANLPLGKRLNR